MTYTEMRDAMKRDMPNVFRALLGGFADSGGAAGFAREQKMSEAVQLVCKTGVPAQVVDDVFDGGAPYNLMAANWLLSLAQQAVFDRLAQDSVRLPFYQRVMAASAAFPAEMVSEAKPKGPAALQFVDLGGGLLAPCKAVGMVAVTSELAAIPSMTAVIDSELKKSVVRSTDTDFLTALVAATTPIAATADPVSDVQTLLQSVKLGVGSKPFFIFDAEVVKYLCGLHAGGVRVFPDLLFGGGSVCGVPLLATDALPAGAAVLCDASALSTNTGSLGLARSDAADLELVDAPSQDATTSTGSSNLVSAWQSGLACLRAVRLFGYEVLRATGVGSLSGVSYGA